MEAGASRSADATTPDGCADKVQATNYAIVGTLHNYPPRKSSWTTQSRAKRAMASVARISEAAGRNMESVQGIIKANWMKKHRELIPSVVVVVVSVRADAPAHLWSSEEAKVCAEVEGAKRSLGDRSDIKIFLALVQPNDSIPREMQSADKLELANERVAALRKRCDVDAKCISLLYSGDVDSSERPTMALRKLFKSIKEMSVEHYRVVCRRIKSYRGRVDKHSTGGCTLLIRYNFKVALYYEAREHVAKALRHYAAAYKSAQSLHDMYLAARGHTEAFLIQEAELFYVAEIIHVRICFIYASQEKCKSLSISLERIRTAFATRAC